jgi:pSer/pThr/pTyr-binding forkhead associated (FHA) protein
MPSNVPSGGSTPGQGGLSGGESSEPTAQATVAETGARLVVIRPDGTEGASIAVPKDKLTIGRDSEVEALSSDPFLSPNHASVLHKGGDYIIHDESSLNGIFREVTDEVELQDGDLIRIGQELLSFETRGDDPHAGADGTLEAGSENPGYWGRLGIVAGPDVETEAYALEEDEITIGRESGDIVFRDDGFVSGTHAQVALSNGSPVLRDLNSSNGTFIRIREDYQLDDGERVLMGQQLFRLETS